MSDSDAYHDRDDFKAAADRLAGSVSFIFQLLEQIALENEAGLATIAKDDIVSAKEDNLYIDFLRQMADQVSDLASELPTKVDFLSAAHGHLRNVAVAGEDLICNPDEPEKATAAHIGRCLASGMRQWPSVCESRASAVTDPVWQLACNIALTSFYARNAYKTGTAAIT
jgi:hypothetical protein